MKAFHSLTGAPWAMTADALRTMLRVAARDDALQAVQRERGEKLAYTRAVTVRNGVAIIPVEGPIFRYANLFSEMSGATSIEVLAQDINRALTDTTVSALLLAIDSPGGEMNGTNELAEMIYVARATKPVHAYIGGLGCSAGYWIASACERITCDATAIIGSIGVVLAVPNPDAEGVDDLEFVSSQSPKKRPNVTTDDGKAEIQQVLDASADVFLAAVARNRGRTVEQVASEFGQGGVFVGQHAVDAGLADALGSFEATLAQLGSGGGAVGARAHQPLKPHSSAAASASAAVYAPRWSPPGETVDQFLARLGIATPSAQVALTHLGIHTQETRRMEEDQVTPTPPPLVLPVPSAADPAMQAQFNSYATQMQAALQAQLQEQYALQMKAAQEQAQLQFERWKNEQATAQAITAYVQDATTGTLARPHALPIEPQRLSSFLTSLGATERKEAQEILTHVLNAGLVSFEELGSSAEGEGSRDAVADYDSAVAAKVATGLSRNAAISAVRREQPRLVDAYNSARTAQKGRR